MGPILSATTSEEPVPVQSSTKPARLEPSEHKSFSHRFSAKKIVKDNDPVEFQLGVVHRAWTIWLI